MADYCLQALCPCVRRRRHQYEAIDGTAWRPLWRRRLCLLSRTQRIQPQPSYYPTAVVAEQQAAPPPAGGGAAIGAGTSSSPLPMLKGIGLPVWVPDDTVAKCYGCAAAFDVLHRRHHCRRCRNVVCGGCSANERLVLLAGLREPVRVCTRCSSEVAREVSVGQKEWGVGDGAHSLKSLNRQLN